LVACQNGDEVAEYMTKSGAAAGFIDALDKKLLPEVMRTFVSYADRRFAMGKAVPVRHEFCAIVGIKA
jgi:hypothetical protein